MRKSYRLSKIQIKRKCFFILSVVWLNVALTACGESVKPNIVLIYADDLGYGDVSCYNNDSKIPTPHLDQLALNGVRFTDAHSSDTICSPSRYGILTGRYSWRTSIKSGNPPIGHQPWIEEEQVVFPEFLKRLGYATAVIGKWGLGSDWEAAAFPDRDGLDVSPQAIDYTKPIYSGRPYGFMHEEVHLWYGRKVFERTYPSGLEPGAYEPTDGGRWYFENGISRGGNPNFSAFNMEEAQMHYIERSVEYIKEAKAPFFLYYAPHIPHWPHVPAPKFQGATRLGYYGDFVAQLDWAVGQIVQALRDTGHADNTMIIFTSDNGPEVQSYMYHKHGHASSGKWRGVKRDVWEGGHRTPFILSWPGRVEAGKVSHRLISQTDIFATVADLLEMPLPQVGAEDSFSFLDEILPARHVDDPRIFAIHHTGTSNTLAIRKGNWVLINGPSGDNGRQEPAWFYNQRGVIPHNEPFELFNLKNDPQQTRNLSVEEADELSILKQLLKDVVQAGRSRK